MSHTLYLPIVRSSGASWGCQVDWPVRGYERWLVDGMIYQTPARWAGLDPWFEHNLEAFGNNPFILGTKTCPTEYRLWPDYLGSQPKENHYDKFASWAADLCEKYHPWGIEIWNEPDVPVRYVEDPNFYGSWVQDDEFYDAGKAYARLCQAAYGPITKTGTKMIAGALLGAPSSLDFALGMASEGCPCDYVSFHKYLNMDDDFDTGFLFSIALSAIVDCPVIWSETNVLGDRSLKHRKRQTEYCSFLKRNYAYGDFAKVLWYSLINPWRGSELIYNGEPTMAYEAWKGKTTAATPETAMVDHG